MKQENSNMKKEITEAENKNRLLELNIGIITLGEHIMHEETFDEYKAYAANLLSSKELYLGEKEVLEKFEIAHGSAGSIEQAVAHLTYMVPVSYAIHSDDSVSVKYFVDLAAEYFVQPTDSKYDAFFAYKIRQVDLFKLDAFLDYQLSNYYDDNLAEFSRFLNLCSRKHEGKLLSQKHIQTINEWVSIKEKQAEKELQGLTDNQGLKPKKGRIKREAQDKLTCLNQEQTVLLMYYLQKEKVLLKDEYLTDMDAGKAFEILTGYSQHTLRQNLSKFHLFQNKANLKEIDHLLTRLKLAIEKDLKEK